MQVTMVLAGYDSNEADAVRKILGKKQIEKVLAEGQKFVARAVANGTDQKVAEQLWEQMAEFAKYSFNRAHAFAYAILGIWTAWFKIHYPSRYLCATLSTVDKDRIPEFVEEARRMEFNVLPPDINLSGKGFTADSIGVRYGLDSVKGVGEAAVDAVVAGQPYTSFEDFLERKTSKCNMGQVKILAKVGSFDSLEPNRRGLEQRIGFDEEFAKGTDTCVWKGPEKRVVWMPAILTAERREELRALGETDQETAKDQLAELLDITEHTLPCQYPWDSEPDVLGRTGKPTKRKPPVKKCSRGCRQFAQPDLPTIDSFAPYTDEDIREIEMEYLGVFLSSTPFDRIPEEDKAAFITGVELLGAPSGKYFVATYITGVRKQQDRRGRDMAFLKCSTERGPIDVTVFGDAFDDYGQLLTPGRLTLMQVSKNNRGQSLDVLVDLDG
jgi:DNA polymerase-3 subunit alpha